MASVAGRCFMMGLQFTVFSLNRRRPRLVQDSAMRDDFKAAFRSLTSSKTFTSVALLVLALGIGASTAIFSVVDAVVLRGLPFDEHDRLVAVGERRAPNPDFPPLTGA